MSSFRRSVGREKRPGRRGSRGGFRNRYIAPKDNIGSPVVFLPGEYPDPRPDQQVGGRPPANPYFLSRDHRKGIKGGQSAIIDLCSAGWDPAQPQPCVWCHEKQAGDKNIDNGRDARQVFTLNLVHLVPYHLAPAVDRQSGQVRLNPKTNEPYMNKVMCEGKGCQHCREGHDLMFGAKKYLSVGRNHLENLRTIDADIGRMCSNCHEGTVSTASFECEECGHVIIDCVNNAYTDKEIDGFASEVLTCPNCRHSSLAIETTLCSECQDPERTTLFDVVLWLRRTGEKTDSALSLNHPSPREFGWCYRSDFLINDDPDRPLISGFEEKEGGVVVPIWDDEVSKMTNPYDFTEMFGVGKPRTPEDQAKRLQVQNPYAGAPTQAYGGGPGYART